MILYFPPYAPPYVSEIDEDLCTGCRACIGACPFGAIRFDEEKGVSVVNEFLCRGCGICIMACRFGAIRLRIRYPVPKRSF